VVLREEVRLRKYKEKTMMTTSEQASYRLTQVIELREWDEASESYLPVDPEHRIPCAHCGKLCQKVYEVTRDQDGATFLIGPSCCKKNLFGWEPEKEVARQMEKEARTLAKKRAHQRLVDLATPIANDIKALTMPTIVWLPARDLPSGKRLQWSVEGYEQHFKVWGLPEEGLTKERHAVLFESWQDSEIRKRTEALLPKMPEDKNWKKRYKLEHIVKELL
jgi:hypothetical protein